MFPPSNLIQDCPVPEPELEYNKDLAKGYQEIEKILKDCNVDKKSLREWVELNKKEGEVK